MGKNDWESFMFNVSTPILRSIILAGGPIDWESLNVFGIDAILEKLANGEPIFPMDFNNPKKIQDATLSSVRELLEDDLQIRS